MLKFKNTSEAIAYGQANLHKYSYEPVSIDGKKYLLCCDNRVYEEEIWGVAYALLENHANKVGRNNIPALFSSNDLASELRDLIIDFIEKQSEVEYLDAFEEY